ncbi:MAG: hypothetical protein HC769_15235 [Cyanobacteria bacterium CRU_2_1]|nr:hypothetical protein [Cyanobacteria bacterium RU_5_0]NJR60069.1 hypothetical protein [Cyanobacteria bacterium CRU_2_1]
METQTELYQIRIKLRQAEIALAQSETQRQQFEQDLKQTQTQLHQTRRELLQAQAQLHQIREKNQQLEAQLHDVQEELSRSQFQHFETQESIQLKASIVPYTETETNARNHQSCLTTTSYDLLIRNAWQAYCHGDRIGMAHALQQALKFTPFSKAETILDWLKRFSDFASSQQEHPFDMQTLTTSPEWQQVMKSVFTKRILTAIEL